MVDLDVHLLDVPLPGFHLLGKLVPPKTLVDIQKTLGSSKTILVSATGQCFGHWALCNPNLVDYGEAGDGLE